MLRDNSTLSVLYAVAAVNDTDVTAARVQLWATTAAAGAPGGGPREPLTEWVLASTSGIAVFTDLNLATRQGTNVTARLRLELR